MLDGVGDLAAGGHRGRAGTGCLAECTGGKLAEYRVKVVLSGPTRRGDVAYYGHAAITPLKPPAPFGNEDTILEVPDE